MTVVPVIPARIQQVPIVTYVPVITPGRPCSEMGVLSSKDVRGYDDTLN